MCAGELGSQLDLEDGSGLHPVLDLSMLHRLVSSFPCLVELSIGQNKLLTDSCLSSVARWEILPSRIIKMEVWVYMGQVGGLFVDPYSPYFQESQPLSEH